jgi:CDP-glucose 4,6-dehydratase
MNNIFKNIYKGKTVLVTGHTGFKGSWLTLWLKQLGATVIGYALEPYTKDDNFVVSNLQNKVIDIRGDIRDLDKIMDVFNKYNPDIVFHLAAQPLVRLSYELPKDTYEINVMGTLNVLECIRNTKSVKVAVIITTDKCYDNKEQIWSYRETDALGGYDPYSSSKGCAEILIASYRNSFMNPEKYKEHGKAIASARAGNVIGGGDWSKDRIIPDCIRALIQDEIIQVRNPNAVRPWQHVLEPLSGYLWLGASLLEAGVKYSGAWNFGPNEELNIQVKDVVNKIIKYYGKGKWEDIVNENNPHEANLLTLDCTKTKQFLQWLPVLNVEETFELTATWYKNFKNKDMYDFGIEQINYYVEKAKKKGRVWAE